MHAHTCRQSDIFIYTYTHTYTYIMLVHYLQSQQAAVDLCRLHYSVPIVTADISTTLIPSKIHQRKLAVKEIPPPQDYLQHRM